MEEYRELSASECDKEPLEITIKEEKDSDDELTCNETEFHKTLPLIIENVTVKSEKISISFPFNKSEDNTEDILKNEPNKTMTAIKNTNLLNNPNNGVTKKRKVNEKLKNKQTIIKDNNFFNNPNCHKEETNPNVNRLFEFIAVKSEATKSSSKADDGDEIIKLEITNDVNSVGNDHCSLNGIEIEPELPKEDMQIYRDGQDLSHHHQTNFNPKSPSPECRVLITTIKVELEKEEDGAKLEDFTCNVCNKAFKLKTDLIEHVKCHTDSKLYYITKTLDGPVRCNVCEYKSTDKKAFAIHKKTHEPEKRFACHLCDYKCVKNYDLLCHIRTHTREKPFSCDVCERKCARRSDLIIHKRIHTGEKPFACNLCEFKCANNHSLVRHKRIHTGEKPFTCELCDFKTSRKGDLGVHTRSHLGETPFACKFCDKKFMHKRSLSIHINTHTGDKPFSCNLCDYTCIRSSGLVSHMRTHTGEKPYSCKYCEYRCANTNSMARHVRKHTGEKPFNCKFCDFKCASCNTMIRHIKKHTDDEKSFLCEHCEYKTSRRGYLVLHMRKHKGE